MESWERMKQAVAGRWTGKPDKTGITVLNPSESRGMVFSSVAHFKANRSISVGVSGRYPFIPPIGLSVLLRFQAIKPFDLVPNLFS